MFPENMARMDQSGSYITYLDLLNSSAKFSFPSTSSEDDCIAEVTANKIVVTQPVAIALPVMVIDELAQ